MKNYKSYFTLILAAFTIFFTACSDEYMENMNTDPSEASTIESDAQQHHSPATDLWRLREW